MLTKNHAYSLAHIGDEAGELTEYVSLIDTEYSIVLDARYHSLISMGYRVVMYANIASR